MLVCHAKNIQTGILKLIILLVFCHVNNELSDVSLAFSRGLKNQEVTFSFKLLILCLIAK